MAELAELIDRLKAHVQQQAALYGEENVLLGLKLPAEGSEAQKPTAASQSRASIRTLTPDTTARENLRAFYESIKDCQKCPLGKHRTRFVFGSGNAQARLMLIGEAPGRDEDMQGKPFVGAAGQLLDRMLAKMGFSRDEVFIANIIKCRPPQNRDPEPEEIATCKPYLERQIELIKPRYIICLGRIAAQTLLGGEGSLAALRGKTYRYGDANAYVTYHPAALLRNQKYFWDVFEDMKLFRQAYDAEIGDKPPMKR